MPFKLKLKKTRQYNVASKSLFVISVELLDGGVADCTLSVDSTGQECLDNVCQRQAINQPEFFGLRYINRSQQPRWVQLDRPLKRQLEKNASSHQLYLRVMYYVISGTSLVTDEVTRYHYFLQLKNDLIEGRLSCDCQQAVVLASYSRQAEYGNHDRERHTVDYLKCLLTFPKQMIDHNGQVIDGSALEETGKLEWLTTAVIQHHISLHNMSQAQAEEGFITTCQQLRGYGQEEFTAMNQHNNSEVTIAVSLTGVRVLSANRDTMRFYKWMDITNVINHKRTFSIECQKQAESTSFVLESPEGGKYVWRMCVQQHTFYMKHQSALSETPCDEPRPKFQDNGLSESREELEIREGGSTSRLEPLTPSHRAHSTSCLELNDQHHNQQLPFNNRALLPSYRPAPDYETAVQQKYQQQRTEAQMRFQNHHSHQMANNNNKPLVYGSHPDIHRVHFPDVTRHTVSVNQPPADEYSYGRRVMGANYPFAINPNVQSDLNQMHFINVYKPPPPYPSNGLASNSTPDLAVASQLNYHRGYINSHVSGSSPDLVSTRNALNGHYWGIINGGSHNLVNYGRPNVMPPTHGTYNDLASVLDPSPRIIMDPHHISDNIQKVYDERGKIMFSLPMHKFPYQRHVVLPQKMKLGDSQEPIYENVPLPWRSQKITMRDRAQSLTTTDEIARLNEKNSSHPNVNKYRNVNKYPQIKIESPDSYYVNAQMIKDARESSRSIEKDAFENVALSVDRMSLKTDDKDYDETPYQSLSTHRISNNNTITKSNDNVTSIDVPDLRAVQSSPDRGASISRATDGALSSSVVNSTFSTSVDLESSGDATKSSVSSKEKKRRRWGMFMGRGNKTVEVKSATLGRDRAKVSATQPPNKHRWSTGLPKSQPLPPSITKETMVKLLERKMSSDQLSFAFEQIPKGRSSGGLAHTALLPQHAHLNAHSDHLPYEDNRVRLTPTPTNPHGYINASHVTMTVGSAQRFYVVAAAGPLPAHSASLWECVWQVGARVIALVGGETRPAHLPPDDVAGHFGGIAVETECVCVASWGATRRLRVRRGERSRSLWHVSFERWAEGAQPAEVSAFAAFLSEVSGVRAACEAEARAERPPLASCNAPLAVCCAQGVGRSGVALAADLLLHILDNNQELDIPRTISMLHQQRANLIQNVHQYRFLHQLLLHHLKHTRLI